MKNFHLTLNGNVLLFFLVLILLVWMSYRFTRKTNTPVPTWLKNMLTVLRAVSIFLILFILFEPVLRISWNQSEPPELAVVIDNSASMVLTDDGVQRADAVKSVIQNLREHHALEEAIFRYYHFANELEKLGADAVDSLKFDNDGTDIGQALIQLKSENADRYLAGVLLLSDGINNLGQNPVRVAEEFGAPIFPIAIGKDMIQKDIIVSKITTNQITYANNTVPVDVTVQAFGFNDRKIQIDLKQDARTIDSRFVDISDSTVETRIRLNFSPQETGLQKYQIQATILENELTPVNNQKSFYVNVLKSKMKILVLAGGPDPDFSFLKRLIDADPNLEANYYVLKNQREFYQGAFPARAEDVLLFDCILLLNFPKNSANADVMNSLKTALDKKPIPVMFIAGNGTFYRGLNPISDYLPFAPTNPSGADVFVLPQLTPRGTSHPVTRIDEETIQNQQKWQEMPPIYLAQRNIIPRPGSDILLQTDIEQSMLRNVNKPLPLLIAMKTTAHKSLAFLGHGIWRWDFLMWGIGKNNEMFARLVNNSIRWLITREDSKPVRIRPDEEIYRNGQKVTFTGEVYYEDYRPLDGAELKLKVISGQKTFEITLAGQGDGKYEGALPALEGGEYRFEGAATFRGRDLGADSGQFSVESFNLEFLQTRMNRPLLQQIADRSGGAYVTEENLAALDSLLNFPPRFHTETREWELWNKLLLLIIVVLLLSVEWFIRKKNGML
ncbi:MAG: hypothetical protein ACOY90_12090 [Candidatus Zhuqueibacterota bacterium]